MEKSASQARLFDSNERSILSKAATKQGAAGWNGVPAHNTHIRTCDLEVPRGHATVKCGRFYYYISDQLAELNRKVLRSEIFPQRHC